MSANTGKFLAVVSLGAKQQAKISPYLQATVANSV